MNYQGEKIMKSLRIIPAIALLSLSIAAFGQSKSAAAPSDAQKSFAVLKSLAGTWQGPFTTTPHMKDAGGLTQVTMRVTSRGNALAHEMKDAKAPDDPTRFDHPLTTFYLENDRLLLTHYCDAGNRPRMVARTSPDGKRVEFDFLDVSGSTSHGRMDHAVFTIIDENHHIEDWTYLMPGDKPVHAHLDLQRAK
jgi:hypothetical protein